MTRRLIIDCEVYPNYFLLSALDIDSNHVLRFEKSDSIELDRNAVRDLMKDNLTISFNGFNYDLVIIAYALKGGTNNQIKMLSDLIIKSKKPTYKICGEIKIKVPSVWNHIDLFDVSPGRSSLKIYGGRLHCKHLQDLPIEPDTILSEEQIVTIREYCVNDLELTRALLNSLAPQVNLRVKIGREYGMDVRSKSDAQIAEAVILHELTKVTGKKYRRPSHIEDTFKYDGPDFISFNTPELTNIYERLLDTEFELGSNGSVVLPSWLKDTRIKIGQSEYQMGIGGLHSCEKSQYIRATDNTIICEQDVASYYPNIILQQRLAPKSLGEPFLRVYQSIVERRLASKKRAQEIAKEIAALKNKLAKLTKARIEELEAELSYHKVQSDTLKISANGSFGKLGSKYSTLYAPDLLIQTTITGQLALLMLIERMENEGIRVASANTDGIVCVCAKDREQLMEEIAFDWMLDTSYGLERTDYIAIASRDVNNYVAVKTDGSVKGKGCFAPPGLAKNPNQPIVYQAVAKHIADGTPIEQTIRNCDDVRQFVTLRRVQGGATWRGEPLGRAVRFYYSTKIDNDEAITYLLNGNRVPMSSGARPVMILPDELPNDIDYDIYIEAANKLLGEIGVSDDA